MPHRVLKYLTAFAVLQHSILGCCMHHTHASEYHAKEGSCSHIDHTRSHLEQPQVDSIIGSVHGQRQASDHNDNQTTTNLVEDLHESPGHEHDSCPQESCSEDACRVLPSQVIKVPSPWTVGSWKFVAAAQLVRQGCRFIGIRIFHTSHPAMGDWLVMQCTPTTTQVWRL